MAKKDTKTLENTEDKKLQYKTAFIVLETNEGAVVANGIEFKDKVMSLSELLPIEHEASATDLDRIISEIFMYRAATSENVRKILITLLGKAAEHVVEESEREAADDKEPTA